jgi:hypothetical protein
MATTVDEWLDRIRDALADDDPGIELDAEERRALLDLARVAAHESERIAAPLTTFIVGAALRDLPPGERARRIAALVVIEEDSA